MDKPAPADFDASERKLVLDALLTYGTSIVAILDSQSLSLSDRQRGALIDVLVRTAALVRRLGGTVPTEIQVAAAESNAAKAQVH